MEGVTQQRKSVRKRKRVDGFEVEPEDFRQTSRPPSRDPEAMAVAGVLSRINGRQVTGWVESWRPRWLPSEVEAFKFYFHEDNLILDPFTLQTKDLDVMDSMPAWVEQQIEIKGKLCAERGLIYIAVRPDEDLDAVQLAARLGKTKVLKRDKGGA